MENRFCVKNGGEVTSMKEKNYKPLMPDLME